MNIIENHIQDVVNFIKNENTCFLLYGLFVFFGIFLMIKQDTIPQWYIIFLYFLGFKVIFKYNKCTLSYIECKLIRNVPQEMGLINSFVNGLLKISKYNIIYYFIIFYTIFVTWYFFVKTKSRIVL